MARAGGLGPPQESEGSAAAPPVPAADSSRFLFLSVFVASFDAALRCVASCAMPPSRYCLKRMRNADTDPGGRGRGPSTWRLSPGSIPASALTGSLGTFVPRRGPLVSTLTWYCPSVPDASAFRGCPRIRTVMRARFGMPWKGVSFKAYFTYRSFASDGMRSSLCVFPPVDDEAISGLTVSTIFFTHLLVSDREEIPLRRRSPLLREGVFFVHVVGRCRDAEIPHLHASLRRSDDEVARDEAARAHAVLELLAK
jgi:hypothetical protein